MNPFRASICWKISIAVLLVCFASQGLAARRATTGRHASGKKSLAATTPAGPPIAAPVSKDTPASEAPIGCDDDPDCAEAVQHAINESEAQQYSAALKTYEAVYQRWPTPWLLINLGRVQQKLNLPEQAIVTYRRYLDSTPNDKPQRVAVARAFLKQAEQEIELKRYQQLLVVAKAKEKPIHKKWWFWAALGGAAAAAITVGSVVGTQVPGDRTPSINNVVFSLSPRGF